MSRKLLLSVFAITLLVPAAARAGRIVVNNDEWTTSNTGFTQAGASATTFVENLADFFLGGAGTGNFLAYSTNFSLNESSFAGALTSAGHSLTVSTAITFDLPTLMTYDAVFLALPPTADNTVLTNYVNGGGGVYLAGGTGVGGATAEADAWNDFLNNFGLQLLGGSYNGVSGNLAVTGVHPILTGVSSLYYNNGNTVALFGADPNAHIIETTSSQVGLLGVYDDTDRVSAVPEPSTWTLLAIGLGGIVLATLRIRRQRIAE
jgi:PEP-CTERM motif